VSDRPRKGERESTRSALDRARDTSRSSSVEQIGRELGARLRKRSAEIEDTIFARIGTVTESVGIIDPEYVTGLRAAVSEALEYGIESIERGGEWAPPTPPAVAAQAHRAARNGVSLDTVLRRYAAGDRIVGEFIVEEADRLPGREVGQVMKARGPLVDDLMAYAAAQYMREMERLTRSPEQRQGELVEKLLADDIAVDPGELDYEFGTWHLGIIVSCDEPVDVMRAAARELNRQLLVVSRGNRTAWAWLGGNQRLELDRLEESVDGGALVGTSLALGEPRYGLDGWRLTHEEALAGFEVMLRTSQRVTRGTDVLPLVAMLRDPVLAKSLLRTYLDPLDGPGESGEVLRQTLRAYFASDRNAATAAAMLGVDRHTVQRRLRKVEEALGRLLNDCHLKLELALELEKVNGTRSPDDASPALG
jgi:hypothetical protein